MAQARVVIKKERSVGVVKEWKGTFGWITPLVPINHVSAKKHDGRLYVGQGDLVGGMQFLKQGAKVDYIVYSDGTGLGAQQVKIAGATTPQAPKGPPPQQIQKHGTPHAPKGPPPQKSGGLAPTAKFGQKFGQKPHPPVGKLGMMSPASKAPPQKPGFQNGAKGVIKTIFNKNTPQLPKAAAPAKGAGKGAPVKQLGTFAKNNAASGKGSLHVGKDKKYLSDQKAAGLVEKWFGKFGWIKPFNVVKHPMTEKHNGMLYCNKRDLVDCETLKKGQKVEFFIYTDSTGIGCDKVKPKGQTAPNQETAKVPEKAAQKPTPKEQNNGKGKAQGKGGWVWQPLQQAQKPAQPQQKPAQPQQKPGQPQQKLGQFAQKSAQQIPKAAQPAQKAAHGSNGKANGKGKGEANGKGKGKGGFQWNGGGAAAATREVQKTIEKAKFEKGKFGNQPVAKAQAPKGPPPSSVKKTSLPPNWQEHWSDEHSVPYFWNKVTKESKWVKPFK